MSAVVTGRGSYVIAKCQDCDYEREVRGYEEGAEAAARRSARQHADRLGHTVDVDRTVFTTYAPAIGTEEQG